jgi:hypothetical protein
MRGFLVTLLFVTSVLSLWFTPPGWPTVVMLTIAGGSCLVIVHALAPRTWVRCERCGRLTTTPKDHYRKVHDL